MTGLEEELEYERPECGAPLPEGARFCTSCGTEFDWDEDETEVVDELLEKIPNQVRPRRRLRKKKLMSLQRRRSRLKISSWRR